MDLSGDGLMPKIRPEVVLRKVDPTTINRTRSSQLSDEHKLEIGRLYEEGKTYAEINTLAHVNNGTIAQVVRDLGLPPRKPGSGPRPRAAKPASPDSGDVMPPEYYNQPGDPPGDKDPPLPEPQIKALERMVLPPKPEPVLHSTRQPDTGRWWDVRVDGVIPVQAESIEDALAHVRKAYPSLRINGIQYVG